MTDETREYALGVAAAALFVCIVLLALVTLQGGN